MSLKKQIKEVRFDLQKRDEELDAIKRNIKSTRLAEIEAEIKTFKEESVRLRQLIEEMIKEGPNHPLY